MSFKKYLEETNNASGLSKEHKLVLLIGKELEENNFKLKTNDSENFFKNFKEQEGKFTYNFTKDNNEYNLIIQNKKDGKYEISLSNDNRVTAEEIKIDNYLKENDSSLLKNYIKDRIKNIEINPLLYNDNEPKQNLQYNSNFDINRIEMNNDNLNINNNFYPNPNNDIGMNFANIGYSDLHGDLPNFNRGFNDNFARPRGNLMGPEVFNGGLGGFGGIGGIRYDPITPFGPKFDFIPQYDGPMRKKNPYSDIDIGIPQGGNGMNNFGGGGYNPFI